MRTTLIAASMILAFAHAALGEMVIEVNVMPPAAKDAKDSPKPLVSIEVSAAIGEKFHTQATIADHTVTLDGKLTEPSQGQFRLNVDFKDNSKDNHRGVKTMVELPADEEKSIAGFQTSDGEQTIHVKLKASDS